MKVTEKVTLALQCPSREQGFTTPSGVDQMWRTSLQPRCDFNLLSPDIYRRHLEIYNVKNICWYWDTLKITQTTWLIYWSVNPEQENIPHWYAVTSLRLSHSFCKCRVFWCFKTLQKAHRDVRLSRETFSETLMYLPSWKYTHVIWMRSRAGRQVGR